MSQSVHPAKAVVLIGEYRQDHWHDEVPSASHPVVARIERRGEGDLARDVLVFDHGVTGHEAYHLAPDFLDGVREWSSDPSKKFYICVGSRSWPSLALSGPEVVRAIDALRSPEPAVWTAHVARDAGERNPDGGRRYDSVTLTAPDLSPDVDAKTAERRFKADLGLDPESTARDAFFRSMRDRREGKPTQPIVVLTFLAPTSYGPMPNLVEAQARSTAEKEASQTAFRVLAVRETAERESGKMMQYEGHLWSKERIGQGNTAGVRGVMVVNHQHVPFIAFGEPGRTLAHVDAHRDVVRIAGSHEKRYDGALKVNVVQRVRSREDEGRGLER